MNDFKIKILNKLANLFGYDIAIIKFTKKGTILGGNSNLLKYVDVFGYSKDKSIVRRFKLN